MITLEDDRLAFRFPQVHEEAVCSIHFQRTLRIPDNGKDFELPPGLGAFPLRHLEDYAGRVPEEWLRRGGVTMPMHQSEALWISFGRDDYPFAVKVATGKVNAVTGEPWREHLNREPQDYVVIPEQPWLDGYCVEKGVIRQFVAMPLGQGYTVEEQLSGTAEWGGLQLMVFPLKAERYRAWAKGLEEIRFSLASSSYKCAERAMGLAPGGRMRQKIFADSFDLADWDQRHARRCFVTILNSQDWYAATGERPPMKPPTAADYSRAGLPWFDYYGGDAKALDGAATLAKAKTVKQIGAEKGEQPLPENEDTEPAWVVPLGKRRNRRAVREPMP